MEELTLRGPMTAGVNELEDEAEWVSSVSDGLVEAVREDETDADPAVCPVRGSACAPDEVGSRL